jgi:hypothetical protein
MGVAAIAHLALALAPSACGERIIVFGEPPVEPPAASRTDASAAVNAPLSPAAASQGSPPLRRPVSGPDEQIATAALALLGGADGAGGRCGSCHAMTRPTLTRWRQLTDTFRAACSMPVSSGDAASVERMLACFDAQAGEAAPSASTFGIYAAAVHLPWFTFVFEHADRYGDQRQLAYAQFVSRVGMPRAGQPLEQAELDVIAEWFERGLPLAFELVPEQQGGDCTPALDARLAEHVDELALSGWRAKNREASILMFGCDAGAGPRDCLSGSPLARETPEGAGWDVGDASIRILYDNSATPSSFWSRTSADGRYVASGLRAATAGGAGQIVDLERGERMVADFSYDPAFFPDNSAFVLQRTRFESIDTTSTGEASAGDEAVVCPQSVLADGPAVLTGDEPGCSSSAGRIGLYQQLARAVDGEDYWVAHGVYVEDNAGFEPIDRNPSASFRDESTITLTPMINDGTTFTLGAGVQVPTPFQGDAMLSPSGRLLITRAQGRERTERASGTELVVADQSGYVIHRVRASLTGGSAAAELEEVGRVCLQGGKAMISYDERWMVFHRYVTAADAQALGFAGPDDPGFAPYLERGAADLYLVDLRDGSSRRVSAMQPGQYALYPHFRSDNWIYFVVRTLDGGELFAASDAALWLEEAGQLDAP